MRTIILTALLFCVSNAFGGPVATVGDETIDSISLSYRVSTERAYGNSRISNTAALVSLVNEAIELRIAESLGLAPTETEISELANHAQQTTKAPAVLARVKAIFSNDQNSYSKLYIAPKVTNRKLRQHHSGSTDIHQDERAVAENALTLAISGSTFQEIADETTASYSSLELPVSSNSSLKSIVSGLSVGSVHTEVIEAGSSFMIIRLVAKDSELFTVEALRVQKKSFDDWFRGVSQDTSVEILDQELKQAIMDEFSGIWWVETL